jgi:hypothetical protein
VWRNCWNSTTETAAAAPGCGRNGRAERGGFVSCRNPRIVKGVPDFSDQRSVIFRFAKWNGNIAKALSGHKDKEANMFTDMLMPIFLWWTMVALV